MTLKELIESCPTITALTVTVRNDGRFVHEYRFGREARLGLSEDENHLKLFPTDVDPENLNKHDDDPTGYFAVKMDRIPKELLKMTVDWWTPSHVYMRRDEVFLRVTVKHMGEKLPEEKKESEVDGQMSIEEWMT